MTKQIHFVIFDAGGGHRSIVEALRTTIAQQYPDWCVEVLNISKKIFDPIDPFYRLTGIQGEAFFYNYLIITKGWLWFYPLTMLLARLRIWGLYSIARHRLQQYWLEHQLDLVVSTIPLYNKLLWDSLKSVKPKTPFATLLADLADTPPHHYIEPQEQFVFCPSAAAVVQAKSIGIDHRRVFHTTGLPVPARFYEHSPIDIPLERQRLGLKSDCLTGLVFFGSQGSEVMLTIANYLEPLHQKLQLIFLCGYNKSLANRLRDMPTRMTQYVEDFTRDVPYFMHLSDFFVGKPGSNSVSEAIVMNLPVIVEGNWRTVSHEKANVNWIRQYQLGFVIQDFRNIGAAVKEINNPMVLKQLRSNISDRRNQAASEIPDMLQEIFNTV